MASKTGSLKLERLTKEFGNGKEKVVAVRELSLTINPGEFVTLLGPFRLWQNHCASHDCRF